MQHWYIQYGHRQHIGGLAYLLVVEGKLQTGPIVPAGVLEGANGRGVVVGAAVGAGEHSVTGATVGACVGAGTAQPPRDCSPTEQPMEPGS